MRFSRLLGKTLKEAPADADCASHRLLVRAGMIQQVATGVYSYLPLGWRSLKKIEDIIRSEMDNAGSQELMMPSLQPIELWEKSGRMASFDKTLFIVTDRKEHKLALGPTHEEVITDLVRRSVQSYRDLPQLLYQIQNKFRDEPRSRGGLLRVREFIMKDLYSFDVDEAGLDVSYEKMIQAYKNVYARCGLPAVMVEADSGAIGGKASHEFMLIAESGEDQIIYCAKCGYAANSEKATSVKTSETEVKPLAIEEVSTPKMTTIEEVANFLSIKAEQTLKSVFYVADGEIIFVVIRGDLDVNEIKLKNLLKCNDLHMATEAETKEAGLVAGYASAISLKGHRIVGDDSIKLGGNFVAGANKPDAHLKNVNYPRDFKVDTIADIAVARAGDQCPKCDGKLESQQGIEVGHIFKLGTFLSDRLGAYYLDKDGESKPIIMGCYGIGVGRLLAAAVEQSHDDKGIIWPLPIAPFEVCLCPLKVDDPPVMQAAEKLYAELTSAGIEVLLDDRPESPGVKFNDADLIGIPLRIVISARTLKTSSVELKWRREKQAEILPLEGLVDAVRKLVKSGDNG
ncbi:MAG: proline--tRNA ligase [Dehalococcoidia bacterium]|nr:proline--tRNA ligase [Dehalococcoidia bacterium]